MLAKLLHHEGGSLSVHIKLDQTDMQRLSVGLPYTTGFYLGDESRALSIERPTLRVVVGPQVDVEARAAALRSVGSVKETSPVDQPARDHFSRMIRQTKKSLVKNLMREILRAIEQTEGGAANGESPFDQAVPVPDRQWAVGDQNGARRYG